MIQEDILKDIEKCREIGMTHASIASLINERYKTNYSRQYIRAIYDRYKKASDSSAAFSTKHKIDIINLSSLLFDSKEIVSFIGTSEKSTEKEIRKVYDRYKNEIAKKYSELVKIATEKAMETDDLDLALFTISYNGIMPSSKMCSAVLSEIFDRKMSESVKVNTEYMFKVAKETYKEQAEKLCVALGNYSILGD